MKKKTPNAEDVQRLVEKHYPGYRVTGKVAVAVGTITTYRGQIEPKK